MADRMLDLMLKLDAARGISGHEEEVAELMHAELAPISDEQTRDPLGNHYFTKRGAKGAPVLMLCAHMDELGFLVQHIEDEGFLRLAPVGYHDDRMLTDQVLEVQGLEGPVIGVVGTKPAHIVSAEEAAKAIPLRDMFARSRHGKPRGDRGARRARRRPGHVRAHGDDAQRHARVHGQGRRRPLRVRGHDRDDAAAVGARDPGHRGRRRERPGGARAARRGPGRLPRAARRGDRARRHARGRHARDRVPPAADQARRRPGDQVLRLGAGVDDRIGRAAAPDAPPRGGRRAREGARSSARSCWAAQRTPARSPWRARARSRAASRSPRATSTRPSASSTSATWSSASSCCWPSPSCSHSTSVHPGARPCHPGPDPAWQGLTPPGRA